MSEMVLNVHQKVGNRAFSPAQLAGETAGQPLVEPLGAVTPELTWALTVVAPGRGIDLFQAGARALETTASELCPITELRLQTVN